MNGNSAIRYAIRENTRRVDHACKARWGFGVMVWRVLDALVSLGALVLAGFAIGEGADPAFSMIIAALIISGPKLAEWWLVREDYVEYEQLQSRNPPRDD